MGRRKLTEKERSNKPVLDGPYAYLTYKTSPEFKESWLYQLKDTKHGDWWFLLEGKSSDYKHNETALVKGPRHLHSVASINSQLKPGAVLLQIGSYSGYDLFNYSLYAKHITLVDLSYDYSDFSIKQTQIKLKKLNQQCQIVNRSTTLLNLSKTVEQCVKEIEYDAVAIDADCSKELLEIILPKLNGACSLILRVNNMEQSHSIIDLLETNGFEQTTELLKTYQYVSFKKL